MPRVRTPEISIARHELRWRIWRDCPPRNWLAKRRNAARSLSKLRVGEWLDEASTPSLADTSALFDRINEDPDARKLFFQLSEEFLGVLRESVSQDSSSSERSYITGKTLKLLRKNDQLIELFLPVLLGTPSACRRLTTRQKRLLHAIVRELTFPRSTASTTEQAQGRSFESGEIFNGDVVCGFTGRGKLAIPDLHADQHYVGFNGNGVRRGQGYKLQTWLDRSDFRPDHAERLLGDLEVLAGELGLIVGGVDSKGRWNGLATLKAMAKASRRGNRLYDLHVRVYASTAGENSLGGPKLPGTLRQPNMTLSSSSNSAQPSSNVDSASRMLPPKWA